jgi:hypothetical protein
LSCAKGARIVKVIYEKNKVRQILKTEEAYFNDESIMGIIPLNPDTLVTISNKSNLVQIVDRKLKKVTKTI